MLSDVKRRFDRLISRGEFVFTFHRYSPGFTAVRGGVEGSWKINGKRNRFVQDPVIKRGILRVGISRDELWFFSCSHDVSGNETRPYFVHINPAPVYFSHGECCYPGILSGDF
jgi:hypothetical protein